MPEKKKKEKKGLIILLVIILLYVLIIVGIAIYVKLDKTGYFTSQENDEITSVLDIQPSTSAPTAHVQPQIEIELEDTAEEVVLPTISTQSSPQVIYEEDELEDDNYTIGMTIADVPAGPRPTENVQGVTIVQDSDVLSASDLHLEIEQPLSIWESIQESFSNFFGGIADFFSNLFSSDPIAEEKTLSPEKIEMLEEINGELAQMQSRFMSYTEDSGLTWIDHVNKPNPYEENGFYMYIGLMPTGHAYHRTVIRYSGKEWIGLKNILLQTNTSDRALIIDVSENYQTNEIIEIGSMNEWVDLAPTQENNNLLNTAVASDNVKITFMGELKNVEWILTEEDMMTLRESMYYYNLLKEKEDILK